MTGATPKGVGPSQAEPVPVSSLRASVPSAGEICHLLADVELTLKHARTFITIRERMHPDGVALYDEQITAVGRALEALAPVAQTVPSVRDQWDANAALVESPTALEDGDGYLYEPAIVQACGDVGIVAEAKSLLADIVEAWWSKSTAKYMRQGRFRAEDLKAAYLIRDYLLRRDEAVRAQAMSAGTAKTEGLGGDSPASAVAESDAPETPLSTPLPSGSIER